MSRVLRWLSALALLLSATSPAVAHDGEEHGWPGSARGQEMARAFLADAEPVQNLQAASGATCTGGFAGTYPCSNVDLLSFLPLADIGGGKGNDVWGWTDPSTRREYAIMGRSTGTAFVDITVPQSPVYLGNLPTSSVFASTWRDIEVRANHAFIVSEASSHGMQVFDLTRLRGVTSPPVTFSADARYTGFATAHTIAINEASGFAYAAGTNTCAGGLHIVDIRNPTSPTQAGCFASDGYTHDVQCVNSILAGYTGRELCFASNEDTLTIVDVTDTSAPVQLARLSYTGASYTHQGWLTDDQRYFLIDDEGDEGKGFNTRTYVFDVANPAAPRHIGTYVGTNPAIDHNQYIVGNRAYQANYRSGLRVLDISGVGSASLSEVAYFDIYPADNLPQFNGAWSVYPFFASGTVVVAGIEQGLYVLKPNFGPPPDPGTMHVGDLDATKQVKGKSGRWQASVTVTVHDAGENTLGGVTVSGAFTGAASASVSGTTTADGTVTFATGALSGGGSVTFTVNSLAGTAVYDSALNHDNDIPTDSNGTSITITKT